MRYLMLLVCLASFTSAYAYNEMVSAIAYNPSRLGAYSYLKVLKKATFKAGLGTTGNLTEINLYGNPITITDPRQDLPHKINVIKSLSNYVVGTSNKTFNDKSSAWVYNPYANGGPNGPRLQFSDAWLTGEQVDLATLWSAYTSTTTSEDTVPNVNPIGTVKMYGGTFTAVSSGGKRGVSVINEIKGLDLSSILSDKITIYAEQATVTSPTSTLYVTDTLTLGGTTISANDLVCASGSPTYQWEKRMTDDEKTYYILARKCN